MPNTTKNPQDPDSPIVTAEGMRKAIPFKERFPHLQTSSVSVRVTASASNEESATELDLPLSPDVFQELLATGPEWRTLADALLRDGLKRRKQADLGSAQNQAL